MKAVGVVIFSEDEKKILLSKRSVHEETEVGKWENVGGKLESGKTFEDTVKREFREELGVEVSRIEELFSYKDEQSSYLIKVFSAWIKGEPN
jgi:mutator protein MutT